MKKLLIIALVTAFAFTAMPSDAFAAKKCKVNVNKSDDLIVFNTCTSVNVNNYNFTSNATINDVNVFTQNTGGNVIVAGNKIKGKTKIKTGKNKLRVNSRKKTNTFKITF